MKQLLIVIGLVSVLTVSAQTFVEQPCAQMRSTSAMIGYEGTIPSAAVSGTYTTYDSDSPYGTTSSRGPKKGAAEGDTPPADPNGPMEDPLGDAVLPLLLLAAGYAICAWRRSKLVRTPDSGRQR